jgi:hypothetical protein
MSVKYLKFSEKVIKENILLMSAGYLKREGGKRGGGGNKEKGRENKRERMSEKYRQRDRYK